MMTKTNTVHPFHFLLLWWSLFAGPIRSYRSPDEYYFDIGKDENLYDTGTLPEGEDVTVYLFHNEPRSYFLPVDGQSSPVSITVVPCSSVVEWKVYFHAQDNHSKRDSLDGDPLFLQEDKSNLERGSASSASTMNNRCLHTFQGRDMTTFKTNGHLPKGILRLALTSKESNSRVQIYASTSSRLARSQTPANQHMMPLLPENSRIEIAANDRHSVTVAWQQSPSHKQWRQHIHYCVTFNPRCNYRTLCSVYADLEGEMPPAWPKHAGFGFRWEETEKKRMASVRKHQSMRSIRRDIQMECVGSRHWASVTSLLAGRRYHVDVFAINRLTNRSSTYTGATFVTASRSPPFPTLKAGVPMTAHVGGSEVAQQVTYEHALKTFMKRLVLFVQSPCSKHVSVDLIYEGAVVLRHVIVNGGLRKLVLKNAEPGNYSVRLNSNVEDAPRVPVKMCVVGRSAKKCPYSGTPNNRAINATANLSSCRSVTLQWLSADTHAKYCLYVLKSRHYSDHAGDLRDDEMFLEDDDDEEPAQCRSTSQAAEVIGEKAIFCRTYKKTSPQRDGKKLVDTVYDLKSKTKYKFRLQVVLKKGVTVDYQPVVVDTEDKC